MQPRNRKSEFATTALACFFIATWWWLLVSKLIADNSAFFLPFIVLFYLITCGAIRYTLRKNGTFSLSISLLSVPILTLLIFTVWGTLTEKLFLPAIIPSSSTTQRIVLMFLNAPLVAILAGLLLAYPVKALLNSWWWLPLVVGASIALSIGFPSLLPGQDTHAITRAIIATGLACFFFIVPLTVHFASKLAILLNGRQSTADS